MTNPVRFTFRQIREPLGLLQVRHPIIGRASLHPQTEQNLLHWPHQIRPDLYRPNLLINGFRSNMDIKHGAKSRMDFRRLFGRWRQICSGVGTFHLRFNLYFTNHAVATIKPHADKRQLQTFMAHSLDEFCDATKFQPVFVVKCDKCARAKPHQLAERSNSLADQQQRFLPAQNAVKIFGRAGSLLPAANFKRRRARSDVPHQIGQCKKLFTA